MYNPEFHVCSWRPVFDPRGHHNTDVFSEAELKPLGGGAGLIEDLSKLHIKAERVVEFPAGLKKHIQESDIVICHRGEETHALYEKYHLRKERMIIL